MKWLTIIAASFLLVGCGANTNDTEVYLTKTTIKGAETTYFICKKTPPVLTFGEKYVRKEFYGEDAEAKAQAACSK